MKLQFRRHGKQFFFFTACLKGRPKVLSRLAEGEKRPILLPPGERVHEALLDVHKADPALTVSDYVVMPDHVHFMLIVDFDKEPGFNPIGFIHWWRERATGGPNGRGLRPRTPGGPGLTEGCLRTAGGEQVEEAGAAGATGGAGGSPPDRLAWEKGWWLSLAWYAEQRKAIRHYIRNNPARALWKLAHPDRFRVLAGIRHDSLDPALPWSAMGDLTLLASPFRFPVRLTRHRTIEDQEDALSEALDRARRGMIPVCGFVSPAEHELERRLRAEPDARWIKTVPHGLRPGYDPSVEDSRALAAGRLLLLSSFPHEVPAKPIARENCNRMNERILALCGAAAAAIRT